MLRGEERYSENSAPVKTFKILHPALAMPAKIPYPQFIIAFLLSTAISLTLCEAHRNSSDLSELKCPTNCNCTSQGNTSLTVECGEHSCPDIYHELNELLSEPQFLGLQNLQVTNSELQDIPPSLCLFKQIHVLNMANNRITHLDPECFDGMSQIVTIDMSQNRIQHLSNGLFVGMNRLDTLNLGDNLIEDIGGQVFSNSSDLLNLNNVWMPNNKLTTLDPWPLIRLLVKPNANVELEYNQIKEFTDHSGWKYDCDKGKVEGRISLKNNQLQRLSNFIDNWYLDYMTLFCFFTKGGDVRVRLQDNPYHCDCLEHKIIKYLKRFGRKSSIINELVCHTPEFPGYGIDPRMVVVDPLLLTCNVEQGCPDGCTCIERPENHTVHYQCPHQGFTTLPTEAPSHLVHINYSYKAEFPFNNLKVLDKRDWFQNTTIIDISHNKVTEVHIDALKALAKAKAIYMHGNNLNTLPETIQNISLTATQVSFYDNQWTCDCTTLWLKHWFLTLNHSLVNPGGILCGAPKRLQHANMLQLPDSQFICGDPPNNEMRNLIVISVSSIVGTVLVFLVPLAVIYYLRVLIYKHLRWHPFDWDECEGEDKHYDVFISYADENRAWVTQQVDWLERQHNFTCCIHERDFVPGKPILDQIGNAVETSKRTLCVLSPHFLRSEFCVWEFSHAFHEDVRNKKRRLLAIMLEEFPTDGLAEQQSTIHQYISTFTYLDAKDPKYEEKLLYAMPVHRVSDDSSRQNSDLHGQQLPSILEQESLQPSQMSQQDFPQPEENIDKEAGFSDTLGVQYASSRPNEINDDDNVPLLSEQH